MKKLFKKPIAILVTLILMLQVVFVDVPMSVNAESTLGNIFSVEHITIGGEKYTEASQIAFVDLEQGTKALLRFTWNTEGLNAKDKDTAHVKLNDVFKSFTNLTRRDILIDGDDSVGVFWIDNGVIWFEFDEDIEQGDVSHGFVEMELEFDLEKFDEQREHNIPFSEDENTSLTIIARPKSTNTGIAKEGHANATKDATFITWTVDVLNGTDELLENASILDIIPDGLSLRPNSIKVYNLDTKLDGTKVQLDETSNYEIEKTDAQFEINFETMDPYKGYRVVYETTITDFTLETFSNTADLKYNDKTISATGSVTDISRSASIEKTGNYKNQNELSWTIDVNKSGLPISNATVTDLLPEGLSINPDSIQVYKITQQGNQWVKGADHPNLANIKATFATSKEIELGDLTAQDAYRIVFDTPVDWSEVNEGDYVRNNSFKNETTLKSGDTLVGVDDATVGIYRNTMIEKTGTNHVNYENKTVSWTVIVNKAQHPLGDIRLTDILPKGLSITESDIVIKNQDHAIITPTNVQITSQSDDKTKVDIHIANVGTDTLTIHYVTEIEDFEVDTFSNTAGVYGDGIGEPGEHTSGSVNPSGNSYTKVNNGRINYQDKTITWTIGVNPVRERITELKIEDYFDHKGMIALPDTFVVKKGNTTLQLGVDYTLAPRTDDGETGYHKGFVINLIPNSNALPLDGAALTVEYKTSFDPQLEVDGNVLEPHIHAGNSNPTREYINTAHITGKTINGNTIDRKPQSKTQLRVDAWNSGKKLGSLIHFDDTNTMKMGWASGYDRKVRWEVYINYYQQNYGKNVIVTDTLSYDGEIDADSVKLYVYNVLPNGDTEITSTVDPTTYDVSINGKVMEIEFSNALTERYVIEFVTSVPEISLEKYSNEAEVKVGSVTYPLSNTLTYTEYKSFVDKKSLNTNGGNVFTGDMIDWEVSVNKSLSIIKNPVITDTISSGHVYQNGSLIIKQNSKGEISTLEAGVDYTFTLTPVEGGYVELKISMLKTLDSQLTINYVTVVTEVDGEITNTVNIKGNTEESYDDSPVSLWAREFSNVGGQWSTGRGALVLTKLDAEEGIPITNNSATFTLWYDLNDDLVQMGETIYETDADGILKIGNLPLRTYYLKEVKAPTGYVLDEQYIKVVVDTTVGENLDQHASVSFENTKLKTEITTQKVWVNGPESRPTIQIQLYRDGEAHLEPVTLVDGATVHKWTNLDQTNIEGKAYVYTVDELNVPINYTKSIEGHTITNTYESPKTEVTGTKVWVNGPEVKPTIELQLFRDGEAHLDPVELVDGETVYTWTGLDKTDLNGIEYVYTVDEVSVPENYNKTNEGNTITNTYVSPKTEVTGTKVWVNGPEVKPTIELQLFRNGEAYLAPVELVDGETVHTWTELDKTDSNGVDYVYTVDEVNVPENYIKTNEGNTITNTYESPKTEVTGTKVWVNGPEVKPTIELQLFRDGEAHLDPVELVDGETVYTWTELDKTDSNGVEYVYTVDEVSVPENYNKTNEGNTITNTYVSPKTEVTGTKVWVNGPEVKPNIMLQLFRNGEAYLVPVELVDGETVHTWTELDKTDSNGVDYVYTVDEVTVPENYEKSIEDNIITNTYVIPKTDITVYKSWVNGPILKPSIEIQLYRDGEPMGDPVVLDDGVFEYTWTDMDATDIDGNVYVYTVDEINVPENYEKDITDFVIVNTYLSPKTTVRADKIWDGGPKPQIEIQLFRNGEAYGDPVVLNEGVTSYLWEDLELTDIYGELYVYTVDELNVPEDYVKHISEDGLTITNTFVEPELPSTGSSQAHVYISMSLIAMGMLFMVIPRRRKE